MAELEQSFEENDMTGIPENSPPEEDDNSQPENENENENEIENENENDNENENENENEDESEHELEHEQQHVDQQELNNDTVPEVVENKWPGWPGESVFRILVPTQKVGVIIGRKGEFIKKMCEEAKARIKILDGPPGIAERVHPNPIGSGLAHEAIVEAGVPECIVPGQTIPIKTTWSQEHQQLIVDAGALPILVDLLKRHKVGENSRSIYGLIRRAADAITNLAHENSSIKTCVRMEGGIPPLVQLLECNDSKAQKAAAGALRTLAFKNNENKNQIVECNALPMLRSEDAAIHYEAVGVIGNLVHSSPNIKKEVLSAGALQPVIGLLSSACSESQREAALLLGQFAATDSDCKVHIVQRGAVQPLLEMLQSHDTQLKEMSAFVLGRLAQDSHNQAGIAHSGGLEPLLKLLCSTTLC